MIDKLQINNVSPVTQKASQIECASSHMPLKILIDVAKFLLITVRTTCTINNI